MFVEGYSASVTGPLAPKAALILRHLPRCKNNRALPYEPQIPHFVRDDNFL
jgi:hypothetical protein